MVCDLSAKSSLSSCKLLLGRAFYHSYREEVRKPSSSLSAPMGLSSTNTVTMFQCASHTGCVWGCVCVVCMFTCMSEGLYVCRCMCGCGWRPETDTCCLPQAPLFNEPESIPEPRAHHFGCSSWGGRGASCLCFPNSGLTAGLVPGFCLGAGDHHVCVMGLGQGLITQP